MPGKHVHFGVKEEFSPTPSPTFSVSTLPSTPGPITPPPLGAGSPYHYTPLPDYAVMLHPALTVGSSHFVYDLTTREHTISHRSHPIPPAVMAQQATTPAVPYMEVECALLPWRITIYPQSKDHNFVTVGDFFVGIYRALRINITPAEYAQVTSPQQQYLLENAYKRRYKRQSDYKEYEREKQQGVKRVDFLGEYVMFDGLSCNSQGGAHWTLRVSRPSPTYVQ